MLWASVVGVVVGLSLATLSNVDPSDRAAPVSPSTGDEDADFRVTVVQAVLRPAVTPSGIRRRRARVTVTVRVRNTSDRATSESLRGARAPLLIVDSGRVEVDPATAPQARGLLQPIPARMSVSGVLRFETADAVTEELIEERRATLRVAGQRVSFEVEPG